MICNHYITASRFTVYGTYNVILHCSTTNRSFQKTYMFQTQ